MRAITRALSGVAALALVFAATLASADTHWAVTATFNRIFLVKNDGGTMTSYLASDLTGESLSGIAVWNNYVFAADNAGSYATLKVGQIQQTGTGPSINWLSNVPLQVYQDSTQIIKNPGAVAVDATGGVYVLGSRWFDQNSKAHSGYAYVPCQSYNSWSPASVSIVDDQPIANAVMSDIATYGSGTDAVIAGKDAAPGQVANLSWVASVNSGGAANSADTGHGAYSPRGIAAGLNGFSYIVNYSTEVAAGEGPTDVGSISVVTNSDLSSQILQTTGFRPMDVAFFTANSINYLGLVGITSDGKNQAWRITLDGNGLPMMSTVKTASFESTSSTNQYCSASADGMLFWATNPVAGTAWAFNTDTWTGVNVAVVGSPGYIVQYSPTAPEPSAMLTLLTGALGLVGLVRRRRRQ